MDQKGHFWVLLMVENCCYCQQAAVYIPSLPLQPRRGPCGAHCRHNLSRRGVGTVLHMILYNCTIRKGQWRYRQ